MKDTTTLSGTSIKKLKEYEMTGLRSTVLAVVLMSLLGGCAREPAVKVITPSLEAIPPRAIQALENTCKVKRDDATCKWIVSLDKHYQKLDTR